MREGLAHVAVVRAVESAFTELRQAHCCADRSLVTVAATNTRNTDNTALPSISAVFAGLRRAPGAREQPLGSVAVVVDQSCPWRTWDEVSACCCSWRRRYCFLPRPANSKSRTDRHLQRVALRHSAGQTDLHLLLMCGCRVTAAAVPLILCGRHCLGALITEGRCKRHGVTRQAAVRPK
jgi:hypothetical protein